jgi:hypothetical protein
MFSIPAQIPALIGRAGRARIAAVFVVALLQGLGTAASAEAPLQERFHVDSDVRLGAASAVCGFEVRGHFEGDRHFTVFYDNTGAIVREVDTFPSLTLTVYALSTGKSYTSVSPAVLITYYTDGAAIGSHATAFVAGLAERIPGTDINGGRFVFDAVVVGYDAAGVPLIQFVAEISSVGPDYDTTIAAARCAGVS